MKRQTLPTKTKRHICKAPGRELELYKGKHVSRYCHLSMLLLIGKLCQYITGFAQHTIRQNCYSNIIYVARVSLKY